VVAQPVSFPVSDTSPEVAAENAVAVWAVFSVLDAIPATPETQLAFDDARRRVQHQIGAIGIDTLRIDDVFRTAELSRFGVCLDPPDLR